MTEEQMYKVLDLVYHLGASQVKLMTLFLAVIPQQGTFYGANELHAVNLRVQKRGRSILKSKQLFRITLP